MLDVSSAPSRAAPPRPYRSAIRERRARETRERILAAAGAEFVRAGYAGTTIRSVASAAGVSMPTVELAFGTKSRLLQAAISFAIRGDVDPIPMLQRNWAARAAASASVLEFLTIVGRVLAEAAQRSAGLVLAAFEAANVDESMRALADELRAHRAETAAWIVDGLTRRSPLRAEITRKQAIDIVWLLMDPHGFCALTQDRGWTRHQFERWFMDSVSRLLVERETTAPETELRSSSRSRPRSRRSNPSPKQERTR
ncbi:MAG: helix-turn-helix transcriptional regulator [Solirubrobacterales bacterium]|nr:helix-turn-helix transcriptional regulator [Solirubrobacterales bacterium]